MYIGDPYKYENNFFIQYDITCKVENWTYVMFNLVINDTFYPGKGVNWTLGTIIAEIKDFVESTFENYDDYLKSFSAQSLYDLSCFSRGYGEKYPQSLPIKMKDIVTREFGTELSLGEINGSGCSFYLYTFKDVDILVFTTDWGKESFHKVILEKGLCVSVCREFLNAI